MPHSAAVIVSAVRTPVGRFGGGLATIPLSELATRVVAQAVRVSSVDGASIEQCLFGHVMPTEPVDAYLARLAALRAGLPDSIQAMSINRLCGSGLQAVISAAQQIEQGRARTVIAGGAESMSRAPYFFPAGRFGQRMGDAALVDPLLAALHCPFSHLHMGATAEGLARQFGITRTQQDDWAARSHNRAQHAIEQGHFKDQILPVECQGRADHAVMARDEQVRFDCTPETLAALQPAFQKDGTVTAGNAAGMNDGAAALVLMSEAAARQQGIRPLARVLDYAGAGVAPEQMGMGPVPAMQQLLQRQGLSPEAIDRYEINEAFAAQLLAVAKVMDLPLERVNPDGSGIALGHPIGATGAILTVKAVHALARTGGRYAIVSLCIGGGQGGAVLLERVPAASESGGAK
ncbi:acetyl-CoA C-acyltransferase [Marinobacterium weihaiense]|uniref:Acetyl-CoA C-acyltransferase n=1 Tax=Marinobacterium weihaiense TaxID=2851016 RepID=A0ABS6MBC4_9GAMM|nr:acetyl-CoA C-acyltransferase [Marinobacterium weihaiense]MBV0933593.1 acetyl-CoA C-acyltransferase [Marinobacterium weihaiense]